MTGFIALGRFGPMMATFAAALPDGGGLSAHLDGVTCVASGGAHRGPIRRDPSRRMVSPLR